MPHMNERWFIYKILQIGSHWTFHWRHNWYDSVSNHQPRDCLLDCLFRCRPKKTSKLRVTAWPLWVEFTGDRWFNCPHKRPVTRKMFPFDDVIMNWNKPVKPFKIVVFYRAQHVNQIVYMLRAWSLSTNAGLVFYSRLFRTKQLLVLIITFLWNKCEYILYITFQWMLFQMVQFLISQHWFADNDLTPNRR